VATDQLTLGEIYEPEARPPTQNGVIPAGGICASDADCQNATFTVTDQTGATVFDPKTGQSLQFQTQCLLDGDGQKRCLHACDPKAPVNPNVPVCGQDFQCAESVLGDGRCMRAPLNPALFTAIDQGGESCMRESQPYEVLSGNSFLVTGSVTGFLSELQPNPATHECEVPPISSSFVRLHQSRIPLPQDGHALPVCPTLIDPRTDLQTAGIPSNNVLGFVDPRSGFASNVCLFTGPTGATGDTVIHFENPYFALGLAIPPSRPVPPLLTSISFNVVGGGAALSVPVGIDVPAQQPNSMVVAADGQTLYIVDEGRQSSASGLRGQLLRVSSAAQTTDRTFVIH
jgi:hypothetical protein